MLRASWDDAATVPARIAAQLVIGVLHGLNIVLMPVLGRLFSLNRKLSGR